MRKIFYSCIFSILLSSCGFHLRQPITANEHLPALQVTSQLKNPQELIVIKQALKQAGFSIGEQSAPVALNIISMNLEKRTYTYTDLTKASEYQLIQTLNYQLLDAHQNPKTPVIQIYLDRIYPVDIKNLSGNNQEEALIQEELHSNAINQLIEQLNQNLKYASATAS